MRLPDYDSWAQIEVLVDDLEQFGLCFLGGPVCEQGNGQRVGHSDGVGHLQRVQTETDVFPSAPQIHPL